MKALFCMHGADAAYGSLRRYSGAISAILRRYSACDPDAAAVADAVLLQKAENKKKIEP